MDQRAIPAGVYQHYKSEYYLVLGLAHHSETAEEMIVYVPLYMREDPRMAVRPAEMFLETVEWPDGQRRPRFRYIGAAMPKVTGW